MSVKPISPEELRAQKFGAIPEEVIVVFNDMILRNFRNGRAVIDQYDVLRAVTQATGATNDEVLTQGWLNVEFLYQEQGWEVTIDETTPTYGSRSTQYVFSRPWRQ